VSILVGVGVVVLAVAGIAWWLSPPAAGASAFMSALDGPSAAAVAPSPDLLCVANLPYDQSPINIAEADLTGRKWMDALAAAGLYASEQPIQGLLQSLIQYTAQPALAAWRRSGRLCVAKSWTVSGIKDSPFSPMKRGQHVLYRASVSWKAEGVAPWLAGVPVAQWLPGVRMAGGIPTTESTALFEIRSRRWAVLTPADATEVQRDIQQAGPLGATPSDSGSGGGGFIASLTSAFRGLGGQRLEGTYTDSMGMVEYTFKRNGKMTISMMGSEIETNYDVEGNKIKLLQPGGAAVVLTLSKEGTIQGPLGMTLTKKK
jgi:hypothetical protein